MKDDRTERIETMMELMAIMLNDVYKGEDWGFALCVFPNEDIADRSESDFISNADPVRTSFFMTEILKIINQKILERVEEFAMAHGGDKSDWH